MYKKLSLAAFFLIAIMLAIPMYAQRGGFGAAAGGGQQIGGTMMNMANSSTEMFVNGTDIYLFNNKTIYKLNSMLEELGKNTFIADEEQGNDGNQRNNFRNMFVTAQFITKTEEGILTHLLILKDNTLYNIDPTTLLLLGEAELNFAEANAFQGFGANAEAKYEWVGNALYILKANQLIGIDFNTGAVTEPYTIEIENNVPAGAGAQERGRAARN